MDFEEKDNQMIEPEASDEVQLPDAAGIPENGEQATMEVPQEEAESASDVDLPAEDGVTEPAMTEEFTSEADTSESVSADSLENAEEYFSTDFGTEAIDATQFPLESGYEYGNISEEAPSKKKKGRVKKGRPRRRKGEGLFGIPNILVTLVWAALILVISLTLGRMAWVCAAEVLAFGREDRTVSVTIYENDSIDTITNKLAKAGLIHYPGLFKLYAQFAVDEGEIHPGMWDLNTKYDYHALVKMMSPSSSRSVVKVLIPEGYSCRQIFALLEENKVCTSKDIAAYAEYGELNDFWFLEGLNRDNKYCLEGFLFPDTYEFYQNDSPKAVLNKMLNNFDKRFDEDMRAQIQTLNVTLADMMRRDGKGQDFIDANMFTIRDVVNVASMIEKETSSAEEGHKIASVIYNRLFNWHGTPAYLNIDATIIYALDGKTDLTGEDLRVDSPYNTYTNIGLTPGPISNPGLSSLQAALNPETTQYYFYVLNPATGSHIFATTQAEHEANRAQVGG